MNCMRQMILMGFHLAFLCLFILLSFVGCGDDHDEGLVETNRDSSAEMSSDSETDGTDVPDAAIPDGTDDTDNVPVASYSQKDNICGCLHKAVDTSQSVEWIKDSCIAAISDQCVACVDDKTGGKECEELKGSQIGNAIFDCANKCQSIITPPDDVAKCEDVVNLYPVRIFFNDLNLKEHYGNCMCTNCFDDFSKCVVNPSCVTVLSCFMCEECTKIRFCPLLIGSLSVIDPNALNLSKKVGQCAVEHDGCFPYNVFDGGTADSGTL